MYSSIECLHLFCDVSNFDFSELLCDFHGELCIECIMIEVDGEADFSEIEYKIIIDSLYI